MVNGVTGQKVDKSLSPYVTKINQFILKSLNLVYFYDNVNKMVAKCISGGGFYFKREKLTWLFF
jgi:hypothetical protein